MTRRLVATLHIALCAQALALAAGGAWWIRTLESGSEPLPWAIVLVALSPVLGLALLHAALAARTWSRPADGRGLGIALGLGQLVLQGVLLPLLSPWFLLGLALPLALLAALALVEAPALPRPLRAA